MDHHRRFDALLPSVKGAHLVQNAANSDPGVILSLLDTAEKN